MLSSLGLPSLGPDVMLALIWSACCFVAGVAFAAYRAVGWVERMRRWAHAPESPEAVTAFVPAGGDGS